MPKHKTDDSIFGIPLLLPKTGHSLSAMFPKQKTISMAELSKHVERVATEIETSGAVYQIKRRTGRNMVLIDSRHLESLEETIRFMAENPNWEAEMEQSRRDALAGNLITLDQFMKKHGFDADGRPGTARGAATRGAAKRRSRKNSRGTARARARAS